MYTWRLLILATVLLLFFSLDKTCLLERNNSALIYSDGKYVINLFQTESVDYSGHLELYGSYREYVLNYGAKYRVLDNTLGNIDTYNESLIINRFGDRVFGKYNLLIDSSIEYLFYYTDYSIVQYRDFINITMLNIRINTTNSRNILNTNLTIWSIALLTRGLNIRVNYSERGMYYLMNIEIRDLVLNSSIIQDESVNKLLRLPIDISTSLLLETRITSIKAICWFENNYFKLERSIFGLNIVIYSIGYEYVLPIKLPVNYSRYMVIGFTNSVSIDSIDWRILVENKSIYTSAVVSGYGYGTVYEERIHSVIRNIYELAKTYGCIGVSTKGFRIIYKNNAYELLNICYDTDLNTTILNIHIREERASEQWWTIAIIVLIASAVSLLITTLYFLIHRVR